MKLTILAVGRLRSGPERELVDDYAARFDKSARQLGFRGLSEVETADEAALLDRLPAGATLLRLDERGPQLRSDAFARQLAAWRDDGAPETAFLIGPAQGWSQAAKAAAPETLSLSDMTLPHRLVRAILAEQLYRAAAILAGAPYHKD